ncbi:MAG TPA: M1 family aminopeptidase [Chitinophagales bacterium]|nr:M1 family aminopeptidase [Chitinophagales bacterium]
MQRFLLISIISLIIINLYAEKPKKRGKKRNPKELSEIVITPFDYINNYKPEKTKAFDLIHTRLDIVPVFAEKKLNGKATLTLKPHFYNQQILELDAKYMQIQSVFMLEKNKHQSLSFTYDTSKLFINLDKTYTKEDTLQLEISYTALPYTQSEEQVKDGRGLYFIDAENKNPYKETHLWTQGEEESNSCWFPTIDATNQKTTEELYVTIDKKLTSISNGLLVSSKDNGNGTKTDYWKQDKPHSPYLFFLEIGNFVKWQTSWHGKEVSAYTFPKYKESLPDIYKNLPEMMDYLLSVLNYEYPWDKLTNVVANDYTAGAMENTSAIIYYDKMLCTKQDLLDENFDWIIMHELFHQWFGDLVTCESWSNLTLNESMADYSEVLWTAYKYGKDEAEYYNQLSTQKYMQASRVKNEPIVNYYYDKRHDLFDELRYEKGGRVLHMLRNYVGDSAFFKSLHLYLVQHAYGSAEIADLRKAFEQVTGEDLNWFFNQWWLSKGHPVLDIKSAYDEKNKTISLTIKQTQPEADAPLFKIPTKIDVFIDGKKTTYPVTISLREQTLYFPSAKKPQLVNFDAEKVLLCEKTDNLSKEENIYKYYNGTTFMDKMEALNALSIYTKDHDEVRDLFLKALDDKSRPIRLVALDNIEPLLFTNKAPLILALQKAINTDPESRVRDKALDLLASIQKKNVVPVCIKILDSDSSLMVKASALDYLYAYDQTHAWTYAKKLSNTDNRKLLSVVCKVLKDSSADNLDILEKSIYLGAQYIHYQNFRSIGKYLEICSIENFEKGIRFLKDIYDYEESDFNTKAAKKAVDDLKRTFDGKQPKRVEIINSVWKE